MTVDSITNIVLVFIGCGLAWVLWRAAQPRRLFLVRLVDGTPQAADGKVTSAFLERIREVAAANGISRGCVSGYAHGAFIRLRFSAEFTEVGRQQLRNWWATFGWGAPKYDLTRRCS
jgi:hypothetical protein